MENPLSIRGGLGTPSFVVTSVCVSGPLNWPYLKANDKLYCVNGWSLSTQMTYKKGSIHPEFANTETGIAIKIGQVRKLSSNLKSQAYTQGGPELWVSTLTK